MAINVTCPSCLKRFTVADKFAGQTGPCPKCKKPITIPAAEEVVIHAPEHDGPVGKDGKSVLKTAKRKDGAFDPLVATGVSIVVLLTLVAAFLLRSQPETANSWPVLAGGSILLGPLLAWAGYGFLRDAELEPYRGGELWMRASIAGLVFAIGWFVYHVIAGQVGDTEWQTAGLEMWQMGLAACIAVGIATFGSFVTLDLEPFMGFFHCTLYFLVTVFLRFVMALPPLPGLVGDS